MLLKQPRSVHSLCCFTPSCSGPSDASAVSPPNCFAQSLLCFWYLTYNIACRLCARLFTCSRNERHLWHWVLLHGPASRYNSNLMSTVHAHLKCWLSPFLSAINLACILECIYMPHVQYANMFYLDACMNLSACFWFSDFLSFLPFYPHPC